MSAQEIPLAVMLAVYFIGVLSGASAVLVFACIVASRPRSPGPVDREFEGEEL